MGLWEKTQQMARIDNSASARSSRKDFFKTKSKEQSFPSDKPSLILFSACPAVHSTHTIRGGLESFLQHRTEQRDSRLQVRLGGWRNPLSWETNHFHEGGGRSCWCNLGLPRNQEGEGDSGLGHRLLDLQGMAPAQAPACLRDLVPRIKPCARPWRQDSFCQGDGQRWSWQGPWGPRMGCEPTSAWNSGGSSTFWTFGGMRVNLRHVASQTPSRVMTASKETHIPSRSKAFFKCGPPFGENNRCWREGLSCSRGLSSVEFWEETEAGALAKGPVPLAAFVGPFSSVYYLELNESRLA